jgi:hypothetical protein
MNLKRFVIITRNEAIQSDEKTNILLNLEHIVSVKPIKVTTNDREVLDGYWVRLSNGKKYRAIQVPTVILESLEENPAGITKNDEDTHTFSYQ